MSAITKRIDQAEAALSQRTRRKSTSGLSDFYSRLTDEATSALFRAHPSVVEAVQAFRRGLLP